MADRVLKLGDRGAEVRALQTALNDRAQTRFYPPLIVDGALGPATMHAFEALGWALGLDEQALASGQISLAAQRVLKDPATRSADELARAQARAPKLHERTIAFDGTPTFWGLGKALLRAREAGWRGKLSSADRRKGVAEKFGKRSQAALFECAQRKIQTGSCPPACSGNCNPANPPGRSSHELFSDGVAYDVAAGTKLAWWQLGLDCEASEELLRLVTRLGYKARRPYSKPSEAHHVNFTASPGPVLPQEGPNRRPGVPAATVPAAKRVLTGVDVSQNQPDVDWAKVRRAGHVFAIAKVSDGLGTPDPAFGRGRWKAMKDAGLIRGVYHFGRPQTGRDPTDEVREFFQHLDRAGGLDHGDLVPVLDLEKHGAAGRLTPKQTLEWARGWVEECRARIGRRPIIYTGVFWRETMQNPGDDLGCHLWLAAYVKDPKPFVPNAWTHGGFSLWQYTETGTCPGIAGNVDLNRVRGGPDALGRLRL
jgi:GH25 family lysozyme M1 (1,4-beta-N-acetylmuramidase)